MPPTMPAALAPAPASSRGALLPPWQPASGSPGPRLQHAPPPAPQPGGAAQRPSRRASSSSLSRVRPPPPCPFRPLPAVAPPAPELLPTPRTPCCHPHGPCTARAPCPPRFVGPRSTRRRRRHTREARLRRPRALALCTLMASCCHALMPSAVESSRLRRASCSAAASAATCNLSSAGGTDRHSSEATPRAASSGRPAASASPRPPSALLSAARSSTSPPSASTM
mmetsp:Transcript_18144/g.44544  ORF Transcript_18144/g.44544 Transcript_18144/m.44544 type:complete len:225 (-) Transcript_18144:183-857(-)